jgi:hypothetical protein
MPVNIMRARAAAGERRWRLFRNFKLLYTGKIRKNPP